MIIDNQSSGEKTSNILQTFYGKERRLLTNLENQTLKRGN